MFSFKDSPEVVPKPGMELKYCFGCSFLIGIMVCNIDPFALSDDSVSMPSVVSEQEASLLSALGRRRFSSHVSSMSAPQAEVGMLPSQR